MAGETPAGDAVRCNVCGGERDDHHLVTAIEPVYGADVWVYDDGYAHVVPTLTRSLFPKPGAERGGDA